MKLTHPAFLVAFTLAAVAATPESARANGRIAAAGQLVFSPRDPQTVLRRTTFGFLLTTDGGATFRWICEQAIGFNGAEDPPIAITESGTLHAGLFSGMSRSTTNGCDWSQTLPDEAFTDLVVRPESRRELYAISSRYAGNDDADTDAGALTYRSFLYHSVDEGKTLTRLPVELDRSLYFQTVEVARSDPQRLYLSALRSRIETTDGVVLVSTDSGGSFTETAIALLPGENSPYVSGVDPKDADHVWVRTAGVGPDSPARLLESRDGGKTFVTVFQGKGALLGFALSPDGKTVWIGGPLDGLHKSKTSSPAFEQVSPVRIECLAAREGELWACAGSISGFLVGKSLDEGANFEPLTQLWTVAGPLECAAGTAQKDVCEPLWPRQAATLGIRPDAGPRTPDAGATAAPDDGSMGGGGCASTSEPPMSAAAGVLAFVSAVAYGAWRRRRRH